MYPDPAASAALERDLLLKLLLLILLMLVPLTLVLLMLVLLTLVFVMHVLLTHVLTISNSNPFLLLPVPPHPQVRDATSGQPFTQQQVQAELFLEIVGQESVPWTVAWTL